MITAHKLARKAAQWVVDSVMGNGLAQQENETTDQGHISPDVAPLARQAAADGCVLLTNDGTLPLARDEEVAVFGRCQLDWFAMGYGSGGDVHPPYRTNLMDGLDAVGARYNHVLAEVYRTWCTSKEHAADHGWWGHWPTSYPEMPVSLDLAQAAARTARTAVVVLGRSAGEDLDVPLSPGGYYLTNSELATLDVVTDTFAHTVVVLNMGNVIDLAWIERYGEKLSAVLIAWQGGMEAGYAVADVLYGIVNPSGRLACTVARSYEDYPSSQTFGNRRQVDYTEGVFVGYRHLFTTAQDTILFPLGHGLSYTTFDQELLEIRRQGDRIDAQARVTNTGRLPGREAVLLWCEPPRTKLDKPALVLAAFAKTRELEPGVSQEIELVCDLKTISSFDEDTHAFVVEKGDYWFTTDVDLPKGSTPFGKNGAARHAVPASPTTPDLSLHMDERLVVERCTPLCSTSDELRERILAKMPEEISPVFSTDVSFADVVAGRATVDALVARLSNDELEALTCGEGAMNSTLGTAGNAGAFGGVTPDLRKRGIPAAICADGPSGARLQRRCSLLPCATALACTFDVELVRDLSVRVGDEVRKNGIDVLLAPGMNIQRNPRCGRNFEYFSEDPLVSGRMAAAVVRGLQSAGVSACPKHFACNNQEVRRNTSSSHVSERALREIYLRGFEICVREAQPDLIMTSYNKVNDVWAHYHYDLATTVLRKEWGFEGVVITDWWMRPARSPEFPELRDNAYRIRAGVDVLMPGSMSHVLNVRPTPNGISRAELQSTARRVLAYLAHRKGRAYHKEAGAPPL